MVDQCARTTSSSSVDRLSAKGSRAGGSMGSSSVTSGWWGVVSSLFDRFGDGGSLTSVYAVSGQGATTNEIPSTFRTRVDGGLFSTTTKTTYGPYVML